MNLLHPFYLTRNFACVAIAALTVLCAHGQVADDTTGVSVNIKVFNLAWDGDPSDSVNASVTGLNGSVTTSTVDSSATETTQISARLAVGQAYYLSLTGYGVNSGTILAAPPPGYIMEIDGVPREQADVYGMASVRLRVRPPADPAPARSGVATALGTERTLWQVSLGSLSNGASAGAIGFIDTGAASDTSSIFSPAGLVYDPPSSEVQVTLNPSNASSPYVPGTIRQIIAPQVCVDVYMGGTDRCELKFYHRAQLGTADANGIYSFSGDPFAWYFFNQDGSDPNSVKISCDIRNTTGTDASGNPYLLSAGQNPIRSKITKLQRTGTAPNYTWTAQDWYDNSAGSSTLAQSVRARSGSAETLATSTPGAASAALTLSRAYAAQPWGQEVQSETLGSNPPANGASPAVVTNYSYYSSASDQSASYGRLLSRNTGGQWEAYEYFDYDSGIASAGAVLRRHRPFDPTATSVPVLSGDTGEITTYAYTTDAYGRATRPTTIQTNVGGTTTAKTSISYSTAASGFTGHPNLYLVTATRQDYSASPNYLTTVTKYFREDAGDTTKFSNAAGDDFFRMQIHSVQQANGVKQSFAYQRGTWNGTSFTPSSNGGIDPVNGSFATRIAVVTGSASSGTPCTNVYGYPIDTVYLVVDTTDSTVTKYKSTMDVVIRDQYARPVRSEKYVWSGTVWQLVNAVNSQWNFSNQLTTRATNQSTSYDLTSGAVYTASYVGERLSSETNETGVTVSYTYDSSDRVDTLSQAAAGTIGALSTKYTYDAAGNPTGQTVGWGQSEQIVTSRTFDDAGRLMEEDDPGPNGAIVTKFTYDPANRKRTVNLPNGGTRIEQVQPNGAIQSVTGTSVVAQAYTYQVPSDGTRYSKVTLGGGAVRYQESWSDWLGRTIKTSRPGFGTQPAYIEQADFDVTSGQLRKTSRVGGDGTKLLADTLYVYDAMSQVARTGLDRNGTGSLESSSTDRITDADQYYESYNSAWWLTRATKTYATDNSGTATVVQTTRARLTGLGANVLAETVTTDTNGNQADRTVTVNRSAATVTTSTTMTGFANPQTETSVNGLTTSVSDFSGLTYTFGYDSLLRRITSTDPRTGTTTTHYKSGSSFVWYVQDAVQPTGNTVATYTYDNAGRVITVANANGKLARTEYNVRDQVVHQWGETPYPVEYGYDAAYGDRTSMRTYRGGTGWNSRAGDGSNASNPWPASTTGTADLTTFDFDPATGLLSKKTDANSKYVTYTYNARGQIYQRTWARQITTTYGYDNDTGELTSRTYSDGTTPNIGFTYTRAGQLSTVTETVGSTTTDSRTFVYDTTNPLQLDAVDLGVFYSSRVLTRQYDSIHRPSGFYLGTTTSSSNDLTQTYTYNNVGHLQYVDTAINTQPSRRFTYGYLPVTQNNVGHESYLPNSLSTGSLSISYGYEPSRDLRTSIDSQWNSGSRARFDYTYNALGQRQTAKQSSDLSVGAFADFGDATTYNYTYNDRGELSDAADYLGTDVTNAGNQLSGRHFAYDFDSIGNRKTASRTGSAGAPDHFTANALNQYSSRENNVVHVAGTAVSGSSIAVSGGSQTSGIGRQGRYWDAQVTLANTGAPAKATLSVTSTLAGTSPSVRTDNRTAFLAQALQSFTYDDDGNMLSDGVWNYTYDAENRLVSMSTSTVAVSAGFANRLLEFKYDYLGRRTQKRSTNYTAGTETYRRYVYDGDNLVAEFDAPSGTSCGNLRRSYTWGQDLAGSLTATGGVGALLQIVDHTSNQTYFPTYDGNGNVVALLNSSTGNVAMSYEYSPSGEVLRAGPAAYNLGTDAAIADNPFGFSTKFTDTETGLVYYGARYYSPSLGRFINRDPIEEGGGFNLYGFCGNDAANGVDYLGYSWLSRALRAVRHASYDVTRALTPFTAVRRMWTRLESWEDTHQREMQIAAAIVASIVTYGAASEWALGAMSTTTAGVTTYSVAGAAISSGTAGILSAAAGGFAAGAASGIVMGGSPRQVLEQAAIGAVVSAGIYGIGELGSNGNSSRYSIVDRADGRYSDGTAPYVSTSGEAAHAGKSAAFNPSLVLTSQDKPIMLQALQVAGNRVTLNLWGMSGGGVGHAMLTIAGTHMVITSLFPDKHQPVGKLQNLDYSQTRIMEGRGPDRTIDFTLTKPVDAVHAGLGEINKSTWFMLPQLTNGATTNCIYGATNVLTAGGVRIYNTALLPGLFEDTMNSPKLNAGNGQYGGYF